MKRASAPWPLKGFSRQALKPGQRRGEGLISKQLLKIIENSGWLLSERAIVMLTTMLVGVWIARYLGPEDFGTYSYALSFVGLFGSLPVFGLQGIVTRELVKDPESSDEILGTVLMLRFAGALLGVFGIGMIVLLRSGDLETRLMIAIISVGLLFDIFGVVDLWFQSRTANKYSVVARTSALLVGLLVKATLVLVGAPLIAFAVSDALQHLLTSAGFILAYRLNGNFILRWRRNWTRAKSLLRQSWPVALSSAGAMIYLKIDRVMIGEMVGSHEVGVYAVAARLSEAWYVIPMAVSTSIFPAIVRSKHRQDPRYDDHVQTAFTVMAWIGIAIAIGVTVTAGPAIELLFGREYAAASTILAVHIWACPAVFMGAVLNKWLIAEDLLIFALTRHSLGAVVNVGLNLVLIPRYGGTGAAIATLVAYSVAYYLACYTDRRTRRAGQMMTRALLSPFTMPFAKVREIMRA